MEALQSLYEKIKDTDSSLAKSWLNRINAVKRLKESKQKTMAQLSEIREQIDSAEFNDDWEQVVSLCKKSLAIKRQKDINEKLVRAQRNVEKIKEKRDYQQRIVLIQSLISDGKLRDAKKTITEFQEQYPDKQTICKKFWEAIFKAEEALEMELRKKKAQSDLAEQEHYARIREMKKQEEISNLEHETRLRDMVKQEELAQRGQESGSKIADYLNTPRRRYYMMVADGKISAEEAERRIKEEEEREEQKRRDEEQRQRDLSAANFDEAVRRMNAGVNLANKLDQLSSLPPDLWENFASGILGSIVNTQTPGLNSGTPVYKIEGKRNEQELYAPVPDDEEEDNDEEEEIAEAQTPQ